MKKLTSLLIMLILTIATAINVAAIDLTRLPTMTPNECDYSVLDKNVIVKADLKIKEDEIFVIPKGKRLVIKNDKEFTVNGKLFIESGAELTIESGSMVINENGSILSYGTINIKSESELFCMIDSTLIVSPTGSLNNWGKIHADLNLSTVVCLGKGRGLDKGIRTDILTAVSYVETDIYNNKYDDFKTYTAEDAKKLFPREASISDVQENSCGGILSTVRFFADNGQIIELLIHGDVEGGKYAQMNGFHIEL